MAKKLADIEKLISQSSEDFVDYLERNVNKDVMAMLSTLSQDSNLFILSGLIRNFFLGVDENRDVDVFLDGHFELDYLLSTYTYTKNSLGGYKIILGDTNLDVWFVENTWALDRVQRTLNLELAMYVPSTVFFNFSSIMFSFKERQFYCTKHFSRFIRDRMIDVVYEPNPNYLLCIVNAFYYSEKFNLKMAKRMNEYIKRKSKKSLDGIDIVQEKHFGRILYSKEELLYKIRNL